MHALRKNFQYPLLVLCMLALIVSGCTSATPTAAPTTAATIAPTTAATTAPTIPATTAPTTALTATAAPTATASHPVAGTLTWALLSFPDSLDIYAAQQVYAGDIYYYLNATLVTLDLKGNVIPYLADSWTVTPDGLTYTFKLHPGVTFQNGDPLTANDFVYTWNRATATGFKAPVSGGLLAPIASYTAVDDSTLQIVLKKPQYDFITDLASPFMGPVDKKAVDAAGSSYGQHPVGCGPYSFVEWVPDDHITLTRYANFNWGPKYFDGASTGPGSIQNLVFRYIPEYSTELAALQSGSVDWIVAEGKDIPALQSANAFMINASPSLLEERFVFNNSVAPFNDVNVRKAFTLATDRNAIVKVSLLGDGVVTKGPLGPAAIGYWPGVEQYGPDYDLATAKQLMTQAGYTYDASGMLEKDGKPFQVTILTESIDRTRSFAQMAQQMWTQLGVHVTLQEMDFQTELTKVESGAYEVGTFGIQWTDADVMWLLYHTGSTGQTQWDHNASDPTLDALLDATRNDTDPTKEQNDVIAAEKYIVDQYYELYLYSFTQYNVVANKVQGLQYSPYFTLFVVPNAYIQP